MSGARSGAREAANQVSLRVVNFERDVGGGSGIQRVVEDGAVGRILSGGKFRRKRGFLVVVPADASDGGGAKERGVGVRDLRAGLAQRREVVENPKRAAVGGDDEIVIVDDDVAGIAGGKIQLERLPVVAVVE